MTGLPRRRWRGGDRAAVPFREDAGWARRSVLHPGTVTAVAEPGLPAGAGPTLDHPGHGTTSCSATHGELVPPSRKRA